jgi:hypothetical protein
MEEGGSQEEEGDGVHGEGFDGPVDEEGKADGLEVLSGPEDIPEVDLHHDGIHHKEQADGYGDGDHGSAAGVDGDAVEVQGQPGCEFAEKDACDYAQEYPESQVFFKEPQAFCFPGNTCFCFDTNASLFSLFTLLFQ